MPAHFPSRQAAEAAIIAAQFAGRIDGGYAQVTFSGPGGATAYRAHVHKGGASWCMRD